MPAPDFLPRHLGNMSLFLPSPRWALPVTFDRSGELRGVHWVQDVRWRQQYVAVRLGQRHNRSDQRFETRAPQVTTPEIVSDVFVHNANSVSMLI